MKIGKFEIVDSKEPEPVIPVLKEAFKLACAFYRGHYQTNTTFFKDDDKKKWVDHCSCILKDWYKFEEKDAKNAAECAFEFFKESQFHYENNRQVLRQL